jgi:uncharacterized repeat protein (TIGR01451 family)
MASGATASFTVVAKVPSSQTQRITNIATVSTSTPDSNENNNKAEVATPVGPETDLQIIKTASASSVEAGGQVMYTLVVKNNGPSDATGVTVKDPLPAGLTLVSAQPSQGTCSGTTCELGSLAAGGSAQILVTANVSKSTSGAVKNTATVIGDQPDTNPKNNEDGTTVEVLNPPPPPQPESDLGIVKTVDHGVAYPGQTLTYTLKVTNHGPDSASNVNVTDTPSLPLKVLSAKPAQGTCTVGRPITCALGTIADGKTVTIKVTAKVLRTGTERNAASVTSDSKDPNPKNNIDGVVSKINPVLHLVKTASPRTVMAGGKITYHLKLINPMDIAAHDVRVCDSLPAGLAYLGSTPKGAVSKGPVCWTVRGLAAGKSRTITVLARALRGAGGKLTNHATAKAKGMKTAKAKATVHVIPAPPKAPTPVTG